ncbi:hypothetical protein Tco_0637540 [Tanacetum coccineum]
MWDLLDIGQPGSEDLFFRSTHPPYYDASGPRDRSQSRTTFTYLSCNQFVRSPIVYTVVLQEDDVLPLREQPLPVAAITYYSSQRADERRHLALADQQLCFIQLIPDTHTSALSRQRLGMSTDPGAATVPTPEEFTENFTLPTHHHHLSRHTHTPLLSETLSTTYIYQQQTTQIATTHISLRDPGIPTLANQDRRCTTIS